MQNVNSVGVCHLLQLRWVIVLKWIECVGPELKYDPPVQLRSGHNAHNIAHPDLGVNSLDSGSIIIACDVRRH